MQDNLTSDSAGLGQYIRGRYRLSTRLGRGSFGELFLAEDTDTPNTQVAVKLLDRELAADMFAGGEIERNLGTLANLGNSNLLPVLSYEINRDQAYIITPHAENGSLFVKLLPDNSPAQISLSPAEAASYLEQIAVALDAAHSRGLVHGDLKPSNILLDASGDVRVSDVGLAQPANNVMSMRINFGESWGNPQYAAPEQWYSQFEKASDIYALGAILFEMLAGQPPYRGSAIQLKLQHLDDTVPSLQEAKPDLPRVAALDKVIAAAMAKDKSKRPASAGEVARMFRSALSGTTYTPAVTGQTITKATSAVSPALQPAAPSSFETPAAAPEQEGLETSWPEPFPEETATPVEAASAAPPWELSTPEEQPAPALKPIFKAEPEEAVRVAKRGQDNANPLVFKEDGEYFPYVASSDSWINSEWVKKYAGLLYVPAFIFFVIIIILISNATKKSYYSYPTVAPQPTGRVETDGTIVARGNTGTVNSIVFVPGMSVAFYTGSNDNTVRAWVDSGTQAGKGQSYDYPITSVTFSPDGTLFTHAHGDNVIWVYNNQKQETLFLKGHDYKITGLEWSPDSQILASSSYDGTVKLWGRDGKLITTLTGHASMVTGVAWSPDGQTLASSSTDNTLRLWSRDGQPLKTLTGHTANVNGVAWSPDGKTLASVSADKTVRLWDKTGALLHTLEGHNAAVTSVTWAPNGAKFATGSSDKTVGVWNVTDFSVKVLTGHTGAVTCVVWSDDGRLLASGSEDMTVRLWKVAGGEPPRPTATPRPSYTPAPSATPRR